VDKLKNFIETHKKDIAYLLFIAILATLCIYFVAEHVKSSQNGAKVLKIEDATNPQKIQKELGVDSKTAGQIVERVQYIHDGKQEPAATYYVQAPTLEKAADSTAESINKNDASLPAAATEKTDRTIVTANTDQNKVDVYKINLRNNHKIKAGVLAVGSKAFPAIGYQAGRWEGTVYTNGSHVAGESIMYTVKQW
jgi:hypothetical protein